MTLRLGRTSQRRDNPMRLRFTIRDLLWLAALVAVCVGWWFDSRGRIRQHEADAQRFAQIEKQLKGLKSDVRSIPRFPMGSGNPNGRGGR
jgi:hypothetical protein